MLAKLTTKLTTKNQITIPKDIISRFSGVQYEVPLFLLTFR